MLAVLVPGGLVIFSLTPSFTATSSVVILAQSINPLASNEEQMTVQEDDSLSETQALMMQSREVAADVVSEVPLPKQVASLGLRGMLCKKRILYFCSKTRADPAAQQAQLDNFLRTLVITPVPNSHIINISVTAKTAERSALLANAVIKNYQRIDLVEKTADLNRVAEWLDARTAELKRNWLNAVDKANSFGASHGLTKAAGDANSTSLIETQISNMANDLENAESKLAQAQAQAEAFHEATLKGTQGAFISETEQPILVAAAATLDQLVNSRGQLASEFGINYPKLKALDQQILATRHLLNAQTSSALGNVQNNLVTAQVEVGKLAENLSLLRAQAAKQSVDEATSATLLQQASSARTIYETFQEHSNEVVDRAALLQPSIVPVSLADAPLGPTFPNKSKTLVGLLILAIMCGLSVTLLVDHLSTGFEEIEDLEACTQIPLLATFPIIAYARSHAISNHVRENPLSAISESVRGIATKLSLLAGQNLVSQVILITSATPCEGKSTLANWLATSFFQGGKTVVLVDANYRQGPRMLDASLKSQPGFTDLLLGNIHPADVVRTISETKFSYIPAGRQMVGPIGTSEIARLRSVVEVLRKSYSLVIFDSPPLLATSDSLAYASVADQTVFVCRWQRTSRAAVISSLDRLQFHHANVAGVVVSMTDRNSTFAFGGDYNWREKRLINQFYRSKA